MEIWKDIPDYEGLYQVSTLGRVKSLPKTYQHNLWNKTVYLKEKILKGSPDKDGYLRVGLTKQGIGLKIFKIHRLVCITFLPNPNNLPEVNHKNEDKQDNRLSNLEWCTTEYNINYGSRTTKSSLKKTKKVIKINPENNHIIQEYKSSIEASKDVNKSASWIRNAARRENIKAAGFYWRYI